MWAWRTYKRGNPFFKIRIGFTLHRIPANTNINALRNTIANINTTYEDYKMIYVDKVCAGAYTTISYLDGEMTLEEALEKLKQHTRNYAKRQLTWFRKNPALQEFCMI